jgi:hypothetical protein
MMRTRMHSVTTPMIEEKMGKELAVPVEHQAGQL